MAEKENNNKNLIETYQIFISYRRDGGEEAAKNLYESLTERGYSVYFDKESMRSGPFPEQITSAIQDCIDFLLILSIGALKRCVNDPEDWIRRELTQAKKQGKNIIPIFLDGFLNNTESHSVKSEYYYENENGELRPIFEGLIDKFEDYNGLFYNDPDLIDKLTNKNYINSQPVPEIFRIIYKLNQEYYESRKVKNKNEENNNDNETQETDYWNPNFRIFNNTTATQDQASQKQTLNYDYVKKDLSEHNCFIFGTDGGVGKTTLLKRLYNDFNDEINEMGDTPNYAVTTLMPIFIDAKELVADCKKYEDLGDHIFLRYILQEMFIDDKDDKNNKNYFTEVRIKNNITDKYLTRLINACISTDDKCKLKPLFIVDALNEIPDAFEHYIIKELETMADEYKACRFLISSRTDNISINNCHKYELCLLEKNEVDKILENENIEIVNKSKNTFYKILRIPFYLSAYLSTTNNESDRYLTKGGLLNKFYQEKYIKKLDPADYLVFQYILPYIAYNMVKKDVLIINEDDLLKYIDEALKFKSNTCLSRYINSYFESVFKSSFPNPDINSEIIINDLKKYAILIEKNSTYEFSHQIYRDFLCAYYISHSIRNYKTNGNKTIYSLSTDTLFEKDIREFIIDLFRKKEDTEILTQVLDKLRNKHKEGIETKYVIKDLLSFLKEIKYSDLSDLDLSGLDLTACNLSGCVFAKKDVHGNVITSTNFKNSKLNLNNIFIKDHHYNNLVTGCMRGNQIATLDASGKLILHDTTYNSFPIKSITGVNRNIKKLLFSEDGSCLYGMTSDSILKITYAPDLHEEVIYTSAEMLNNFEIENGEIYFTTVFNPLNRKNINNPEERDEIKFLCPTNIAAISKDKQTIVCGSVNNNFGIKIYKKSETGWTEHYFEYHRIIDELFKEIKSILKENNETKLLNKKKDYIERHPYILDNLNAQFKARNHDLEKVPEEIKKIIISKITNSSNNILISALEDLTDRYTSRLRTFISGNQAQLCIYDRKLASIDLSPDGKKFLLSFHLHIKKDTEEEENNENNKKPYNKENNNKNKGENNKKQNNKKNEDIINSTVLEYDSETDEYRYIVFNSNKNTQRAYYMDDCIFMNSKNCISFYRNTFPVKMIHTQDISIRKVIKPETPFYNKNTFFAVAVNFIYEIDAHNFRIIRAINTNKHTAKDSFFYADENIQGFVLKEKPNSSFLYTDGRKQALKTEKDGKSLIHPNNENKRIHEPENKNSKDDTKDKFPVIFDSVMYKESAGKIIRYTGNGFIKTQEIPLCNRLYVAGCRFEDTEGNIAENSEYQRLLYNYGAEIVFSDNRDMSYLKDTVISVAPDSTVSQTVTYTKKSELTDFHKNIRGKRNPHIPGSKSIRDEYLDKLWKSKSIGYEVLSWLNRLEYVKPDTLVRISKNDCDEEYIKDYIHMHLFKEHAFIDFKNQVYSLSDRGETLLQLLNNTDDFSNEKNQIKKDSSDTPEKKVTRIALNDWLSHLILHYGQQMSQFRFNTVFNTDNACDGTGRINCVFKLNDQPYFVVALSNHCWETDRDDFCNKTNRISYLTENYNTLFCNGADYKIAKRPYIIYVCENYNLCEKLKDYLINSNKYRNNILFSHFALSEAQIKENTSFCFRFFSDKPYFISME